MRRRIYCFLLITLFFACFCYPNMVYADDELAPGSNECVRNAETSWQSIICYEKAIKYWSPRLEKAYAYAKEACTKADNPQQCLNRLKKMQRTWLSYSDQMIDYLRGEKQEDGGYSMGELAAAKYFEAVITKLQCQSLYYDCK